MTLGQLFLLVQASTPPASAPAVDEAGTLGDLLELQSAAARGGWRG